MLWLWDVDRVASKRCGAGVMLYLVRHRSNLLPKQSLSNLIINSLAIVRDSNFVMRYLLKFVTGFLFVFISFVAA